MSTHLRWTAAATFAAAALGTLGTHPRSDWYLSLRKPPWQPPSSAFGPVWTTLYTSVAAASARALDRTTDADERARYAGALAVNLALNAGFSWLYFTAKNQRAALVDQVLLGASTVDLVRRSARVDRTSAALLLPYLGWALFATALNARVIQLNPQST